MCGGGPGCRRRSNESGGSKDLIRVMMMMMRFCLMRVCFFFFLKPSFFLFFMFVFDAVIRFHKKCYFSTAAAADVEHEQLHTVVPGMLSCTPPQHPAPSPPPPPPPPTSSSFAPPATLWQSLCAPKDLLLQSKAIGPNSAEV
jgi:hypothetical protein